MGSTGAPGAGAPTYFLGEVLSLSMSELIIMTCVYAPQYLKAANQALAQALRQALGQVLVNSKAVVVYILTDGAPPCHNIFLCHY